MGKRWKTIATAAMILGAAGAVIYWALRSAPPSLDLQGIPSPSAGDDL